MRFCSAAWCIEAMTAANETTEFIDGLADPASFDLVVGFACSDLPEVASWARFEGGRITAWEAGPARPGPDTATMQAPLAVWRSAAEGEELATALLLAGRIKLRDTRNRVTYNYGAFDQLLASWGNIATDWDRAS